MAVFWVVALCRRMWVYRRFRGLYCLIALMKEAAQTSETSVNSYQPLHSCNREDSHLHSHSRENLTSHWDHCLLADTTVSVGAAAEHISAGNAVPGECSEQPEQVERKEQGTSTGYAAGCPVNSRCNTWGSGHVPTDFCFINQSPPLPSLSQTSARTPWLVASCRI
jgi:hypothetical protein